MFKKIKDYLKKIEFEYEVDIEIPSHVVVLIICIILSLLWIVFK